MAAPPWAQVKLRVAYGEVPPFGAVLVMSTGRRYQVVGVRGKTLQCLVLPPDAEVEPGTPIWEWRWAKKRPRSA
jgi:hypothetical protein